MDNEDNQLDDSELCRRTEQHIKEINKKNKKMTKEIYDKYRKYDKFFQGDDLPLDDTGMYERLNKFKEEYAEALDKQFEEKYAQYLKDMDEIKKSG